MFHQASRRRFLQTSAAAGVGFWVAGGLQAKESNSPNEKIRFASIGVEGKGASDSEDAGRHGDMVAICDIDDKKLDAASKRFEGAKKYNDFRKMLDEMGSGIDAVTVSTPDHTHAAAALMAMRLGKHCFCQKPLTHSLHEARLMAGVAREKKVATQMGNQGTANDSLRKAAAVLKSGALGTIQECHVWTNRPIWKQGIPRPQTIAVPPYLHWEEWLGPAPYRPFGDGYHPFSWRGWWDFGTGALGDMACHTLNMPFMGLNLRDPISVQAETSGHNGDSYPKWSTIHFAFPSTPERAALTYAWYDGGNDNKQKPGKDMLDGKEPAASGCLVIGEKGKLYAPGDYAENPIEYFGGIEEPKVEWIKSPGHFQEWVRAIRGGEPAMSNFPDYSGALTETVLLGNLAVWAAPEPGLGKKIEWDAKNLVATNAPEVMKIVKPTFRAGYSIDV
ncbi:MAG TPA: Gfo/Idh/MocA family oxidoreductase [Pirellulales bacterium]|nr:Gfo/Idh/MocA family oxidoreductase [Pirellulales bacterium]